MAHDPTFGPSFTAPDNEIVERMARVAEEVLGDARREHTDQRFRELVSVAKIHTLTAFDFLSAEL